MSEGFWIGLQMDHDAALAKDALAKTLANIKPWKHGENEAVEAQQKNSADS